LRLLLYLSKPLSFVIWIDHFFSIATPCNSTREKQETYVISVHCVKQQQQQQQQQHYQNLYHNEN